jgi:hypothetical protein
MCTRSEKKPPGKKGSLLPATFSDKFTDKLKESFAESVSY